MRPENSGSTQRTNSNNGKQDIVWVDSILKTIELSFSPIQHEKGCNYCVVKLQVLGLRLGVDFTFTLDNNENNDNNPHLNFFKGTVLGVKEQGLGIRDKG